MFWRKKPKSAIRGFIFTDGTIETCSQQGEDVVVDFLAYDQTRWRFTFVNVTRVLMPEPVENIGVMHSSYYFFGEGWVLNLKDDDRMTVLEIVYEHVRLHTKGE